MSSGTEIVNLDRVCAAKAVRMVTDVKKAGQDSADTLITKALGVLQEQGLYALVLFCDSRKEEKGTGEIKNNIFNLLKEQKLITNNSPADLTAELSKENGLLSNLDELFLAIFLIEKTLIYARYHAKALKKEGAGQRLKSGGEAE